MSGSRLQKGNAAAYEQARAAHLAKYPDRPLVEGVREVNDQGDGLYFIRLMLDRDPLEYTYWRVDFHSRDDGCEVVEESLQRMKQFRHFGLR